jgi:hypothetical protein
MGKPAITRPGRRFDRETLLRIKAAHAWRPVAGDTVSGTIVAVVPRDGDYGRYPVVVLDTGDDAFTAVHAFHGVLGNELRDMKAAPGMDIAIRYSGRQDSRKRKDASGDPVNYHGYSVVPDGGADLETWDFSDAPTSADDQPGY